MSNDREKVGKERKTTERERERDNNAFFWVTRKSGKKKGYGLKKRDRKSTLKINKARFT